MKQENLSSLVVAPKDIDFLVEKASSIISQSIEIALNINV